MTEYVGEWHTVTVERIECDCDLQPCDIDNELDFDLQHLDSCPKSSEGPEGGPFRVTYHDCDLGLEVTHEGFEGFDITKPGTYRARLHYWPGDGWEIEPNAEVEVEAVEIAAAPDGTNHPEEGHAA